MYISNCTFLCSLNCAGGVPWVLVSSYCHLVVYFCSSLKSTLEKHGFVGGLCTRRILRRWMQGFWSNEYLKNYLFSSLLEEVIVRGFGGIFPASLSNFNMNFSLLSELLLLADWSACEQKHLFKGTYLFRFKMPQSYFCLNYFSLFAFQVFLFAFAFCGEFWYLLWNLGYIFKYW